MSTANPYQVPLSNVDHHVPGDYSEVKVLSVKGRIGRLRYLGYSMGYSMLIYLLFAMVGGAMYALGLPQAAFFGVLGIGYVLVVLLSIMLTIQRAHDFNTTGWITLLLLVPLVNLMFLFIPGTDGENRFGKKTPPNRGGMIWWVLIPVFVAILGILAAIAIPAYQAYLTKAQAASNNLPVPASQPE